MTQYSILASTDEYTVVSEYKSEGKRAKSYQSEADLENAFIKQLVSQGAEIEKIVAREQILREEIDKIIAEIEVGK